MSRLLTQLTAGQELLYGGNRVTVVSAELAEAFEEGDRLVIVQQTGDLLHIPGAEHALVSAAVTDAAAAFTSLAACSDDQITDFFECFARKIEDDAVFSAVTTANVVDVDSASARGRSTTRLQLTAAMRSDMAAGLRSWAASPTRRQELIGTTDHDAWSVSSWRAPLGVVGFVFEGRPNVFADATGVLRTGNTAVFRIGSDAWSTARQMMHSCVEPALREAGLPAGSVRLVESAAHAAGWALFSDQRLALAVARGSGTAVTQLGAVARQHGVPVSLHGTGGAWIVVSEHADPGVVAQTIEHSLDRKVCNTMNVCCVPRAQAAKFADAVSDAADRAAAKRGTRAVVHRVAPAQYHELGHEWEWENAPEYWLVGGDSLGGRGGVFNPATPAPAPR